MSRQPDDHDPMEEFIFLTEKDLGIACEALKEIQKLPSARMDKGSTIAWRALKDIKWGGK